VNDSELLRYSRHILLNEIDVTGQQALIQARVLIIGAGGLGSAAALYLAGSGIGHISIADGDTVDLSNLQRQVIHNQASLGQNKALSATQAAKALNPHPQIFAIPIRLQGQALDDAIAHHDIIVDCCDNFTTRYAINRACVRHAKPLVSGAAIQFDGLLTTFDRRIRDSPCYHCLFPETSAPENNTCSQNGVFAPLVGIIGASQAAEAIKLITSAGRSLHARLLRLDGLNMVWHESRLVRDPHCEVCQDPLR
jgi:adenylyltransferase/sulfurtransferase